MEKSSFAMSLILTPKLQMTEKKSFLRLVINGFFGILQKIIKSLVVSWNKNKLNKIYI